MFLDQLGWTSAFRKKGALWVHDGNLEHPHALLASNKHSNGYFESELVVEDQELLTIAAVDLFLLFRLFRGEFRHLPQIVVGPQTGATKLAEHLAHVAGARWASPTKGEHQGREVMVFTDEERAAIHRTNVLICDDVLTTGGSVERTAEAVEYADGVVLPFVLTLVNRSGAVEVDGRKILSLINYEMPMWEPDECPLCKAGSKAVRPDKDNWDELTAVH